MHVAVSLISVGKLRPLRVSLISLCVRGTIACNCGVEASASSLMLLGEATIVVNVVNDLVMLDTNGFYSRFIFFVLNESVSTQTILYKYQTWSVGSMGCKDKQSQARSYLRIEHMLFDDHIQNWPKGEEHIPQIVFRNAFLLRNMHSHISVTPVNSIIHAKCLTPKI